MEAAESEKFEVRLSRWKWGVVTLFCVAPLLVIGLIANVVPFEAFKFSAPGFAEIIMVLLIWISVINFIAIFSVVLRSRPLCEIDHNGITDYGLFFSGFGLIRWEEIESITLWEIAGPSLFVKVKNFDRLCARRNPLLQPFLRLHQSAYILFFGGHVWIPTQFGNTNPKVMRERLARFSPPGVPTLPMVLFKIISISLAIGVSFLIWVPVGMIATAYAVSRYHEVQDPVLHIDGIDAKYGDVRVQIGKQVWVQTYSIENTGKSTNGLHVDFSGSAFDNVVERPRVLLEYEEPESGVDKHPLKFKREIIELTPDKNHWVGDSKRAFLPHKFDMNAITAMLMFLPRSRSEHWPIDLKIELFGDISQKGTGNMSLTVVPSAYPSSTASLASTIVASGAKSGGRTPIVSADIPEYFPVTSYPDSHIISMSQYSVQLESSARPDTICEFYEKQLKQKGWETAVKEHNGHRELVVARSKGNERIKIRIVETTPYDTSVDIEYSPTCTI
ncbi:MAG: hypothetical protein KGS72_07045 [Cyanobacteria bacterium REEB67]|nr:hypothetical protein [Cyanobacteria bacterium REEB67]